MNTPICDFVDRYCQRNGLRLHMPGHKGSDALTQRDITEIAGADELYHPAGIIRESEENAARLFGTARTVYSAEGSSLCIRAMVHLALLLSKEQRRAPVILAGRNAHKTLLSAAALLGADIQWLYGDDLISCPVTALQVDHALRNMAALPAAVYLTSPDYLGHRVDIAGIARACHGFQVPLLVDNAHGAYLKFLPDDQHPITLGADMACDSAHKTLPVLTGGAYLHIGRQAPTLFSCRADAAMALFASTSPSYLILQSLDRCNRYLAEGYREKLASICGEVRKAKEALSRAGYLCVGDEPMKITLQTKPCGYTGHQLHDVLRERGMECEFSDPDFLTAMVTPETGQAGVDQFVNALLSVPRKTPVSQPPPVMPRPKQCMAIREALLSPAEEVSVDQALGRILSSAHTSCPPAVPIAVSGEMVDEQVIKCLKYYGVESVWTVKGT